MIDCNGLRVLLATLYTVLLAPQRLSFWPLRVPAGTKLIVQ